MYVPIAVYVVITAFGVVGIGVVMYQCFSLVAWVAEYLRDRQRYYRTVAAQEPTDER